MAFVGFSRGMVSGGFTPLSNVFLEEHLPTANGDCVRVYLYGLLLCQNATGADNTLERMSAALGIPMDDIRAAFEYWQDCGLVQIIETDPFEIKYLPIKPNAKKVRSLPRGKYDDFNAKVQSILDGRMVTTTEFNEYYAFLESMHFEPAALLILIQKCVAAKGPTIGYHYILTRAKNLAYLALCTPKQVTEYFNTGDELQKLMKDLNGKPKKDFIKHSFTDKKEVTTNANEIEF